MSVFARILLEKDGGMVHSSFESVASGPSGCICERSSWCAHVRDLRNQLSWYMFLLYFWSKIALTNRDLKFLLQQLFYMYSWYGNDSWHATQGCHHNRTSRLAFMVGDGLSMCHGCFGSIFLRLRWGIVSAHGKPSAPQRLKPSMRYVCMVGRWEGCTHTQHSLQVTAIGEEWSFLADER